MDYSASANQAPNTSVKPSAKHVKASVKWSASNVKGPLRTPNALQGEGEIRKEIRSYLEKAPEGVEFKKGKTLELTALISGVGWCLLSIMLNQPLRMTLTAASLSLSTFIWFDPFRLIHRWIAKPTRAMTSILILAWMIVANTKDISLCYACIAMTAACAVLIVGLNKRWLAKETYKRSMAGRDVVAGLYPQDIEEVYENKLKAEINAFGYDAGAPVDDEAEIFVRKGCAIIGLTYGLATIREAIIERDQALSERERLMQETIDLNRKLNEVYGYVGDMKRLPDLERRCSWLDEQMGMWSTRCARAEDKCEKLLAENVELGDKIVRLNMEISRLKMEASAMVDTSVVDEGPAIEPDKRTFDERVVAFLCTWNPDTRNFNGIGIAAKEFCVTDYQIRKIYNAHRGEIDAERARFKEGA